MPARIANVTAAESATVQQSAVQLMLEELRRCALVPPDEWAALPVEFQKELGEHQERSLLLERLVKLRLLTAYQATRISAGSMEELILGNYRVLDVLGSGGMAMVMKAEHHRLRRAVAIKVVQLAAGEDSSSMERFFNEMRAVARLNHPSIAAALDAGEEPGRGAAAGRRHYFVMEYVPGQDLEEYVKTHGPLDPALACDLAFQVAGALQEAHEHHLVHRDIKPSNIRVTPEGQAKLLDFGIVRDFRSRLTLSGTVLGSVAYLAPEQAEDSSSVDIRADIYALGGSLFWSLTGQCPFPPEGNLYSQVARREKQPPPLLRTVRPDVPAELEAVLVNMMATRREDRYLEPKDVRRALVPFLKAGSPARSGQAVPSGIDPNSLGENNTTARCHRILIVDDEASNRTLFCMMLASAGAHFEEAADGAMALEVLQARPFDLVVLDVDMPKMKGTDVLRRLREAPPRPHLKIIMVSGQATPDDMAEMMHAGADDYLTKPVSSTQLQARVKAALRLKDAQVRSDTMQGQMLAANQDLEQNLHARDSDLIHARNALVLALAELVSYRDYETGDHLARLQTFSRCLAETAVGTPGLADQIDVNFIQMLECCAPLHDIGKAGLPDQILLKPGKLTPDEFVIMQTHTTIGADILEKVASKHCFARTFLRMARDITRHHHERFDGTGYPDSLAGDAIPLAARIVALADVYDALRSRRVYKPALTHAAARRIILQESPGHFDPALLHVFQKCEKQFEKRYGELVG
jgi:response regulator RpfG family c-di-GMP phosphodiesterase/serine/threonine protein kinase